MDFDVLVVLIICMVLTLVYAFKLIRKAYPFMQQLHRISLLKDNPNLISVNAEIVKVEMYNLNGFEKDFNRLYVMRVCYQTDNLSGRPEYSDIIFAKQPPERAGENITVLYNSTAPSEVMTPGNRESAGAAAMFLKLAVSVVVVFVIIFPLSYILWKSGLFDDD